VQMCKQENVEQMSAAGICKLIVGPEVFYFIFRCLSEYCRL
jgi:hypothetical protein